MKLIIEDGYELKFVNRGSKSPKRLTVSDREKQLGTAVCLRIKELLDSEILQFIEHFCVRWGGVTDWEYKIPPLVLDVEFLVPGLGQGKLTIAGQWPFGPEVITSEKDVERFAEMAVEKIVSYLAAIDSANNICQEVVVAVAT